MDANSGGVFHELREMVAWVVAGIGGLFLGVHKLNKLAAADHKSSVGDNATATVIALLRTEVERLTSQNTSLAASVNELQAEVLQLRETNTLLRAALYELQHGKPHDQVDA